MAAEVWYARAFCCGSAIWCVRALRCDGGGKNWVDWRRGILCPEGGNCGGDFLLEDFDEFLVSVDDFLLGFDLED